MDRIIYRPVEIKKQATNIRTGALIVSITVTVTILVSLYSVYTIFLGA